MPQSRSQRVDFNPIQSAAETLRELAGNAYQTAESIAMIPVLLALGATGAVLELRRFVQRSPDLPVDVQSLQENELRLRRVLQVCSWRLSILVLLRYLLFVRIQVLHQSVCKARSLW